MKNKEKLIKAISLEIDDAEKNLKEWGVTYEYMLELDNTDEFEAGKIAGLKFALSLISL